MGCCMARNPSLLADGVTFLLAGRAAAQLMTKTPSGDAVATASPTVIEVHDAATNMHLWQAKANVAGGGAFVSDGNPRHPERGH